MSKQARQIRLVECFIVPLVHAPILAVAAIIFGLIVTTPVGVFCYLMFDISPLDFGIAMFVPMCAWLMLFCFCVMIIERKADE